MKSSGVKNRYGIPLPLFLIPSLIEITFTNGYDFTFSWELIVATGDQSEKQEKKLTILTEGISNYKMT